MKIILACYGSRGDVEPGLAVGLELSRRGHDVCMAVPPDLVDFVEAARLPATAYGANLQASAEAERNYWKCFFRSPWRVRDLRRLSREMNALIVQGWQKGAATVTSLAAEADLLVTAWVLEELSANAAEFHDIPLATLHYLPVRVNGRLLPFLPAPMGRVAMRVREWLYWRATKRLDDAMRRELGLPDTTAPGPRRIAKRGSMEIQAYDEVCFPGLAAEWAEWKGRRPFVGALTLELPTDTDEGVTSWLAAGAPPIYFGFGSVPVQSGADTLAMIDEACAQLGERALVCSGGTDFGYVPLAEHLMVVDAVNHAKVFPACRAVVHHGGAGTTAAGLRAGVPTLVLWTLPDQPLFGAAIKRLRVGTARRFSATTKESLVADLRTILTPHCAARAREISTQMTKAPASVAAAADHLEKFASR